MTIVAASVDTSLPHYAFSMIYFNPTASDLAAKL
jgi:hypothetical protein